MRPHDDGNHGYHNWHSKTPNIGQNVFRWILFNVRHLCWDIDMRNKSWYRFLKIIPKLSTCWQCCLIDCNGVSCLLTKSLDQKYSMGMLINQIKKVYLTITKCSCQIRSRASLHNPNWANTFYLKGSQYILVLLHSVPERFKLMTSCNRQHLPPTRLRTKHLTLTNCFLNVAVTTLTLNCKVELNLTELQTTPFGLLSTQYTKRLISQVIRVTASM